MKAILTALISALFATPLWAHDPLAFASGSWFNLERNGEGFVVQILPDEVAVVTWFTYPPVGEPGEQAWMLGTGTTQGSKIVLDNVERPTGGIFGPEFDPATVIDGATYDEPQTEPEGIRLVVVNGAVAYDRMQDNHPGIHTGAGTGKMLRYRREAFAD